MQDGWREYAMMAIVSVIATTLLARRARHRYVIIAIWAVAILLGFLSRFLS